MGGALVKIFGKEARPEDFALIVQSLHEISRRYVRSGDLTSFIDPVADAREISEETFIDIADRVGGSIFEATPGRLTIPEIRGIKGRVSQFENLSDILERYGYREAALFKRLAEAGEGRVDALYDLLSKDRFDLIVIPREFMHDEHFFVALVSSRPHIYRLLPEHLKTNPFIATMYLQAKLLHGGRIENRYFFEDLPDSFRLNPDFLLSFKQSIVDEYGTNIIPASNFEYLEKQKDSLPIRMADFGFWMDFYDGDKAEAFEVGNALGIIPRDTIRSEYLSRPDASEYFDKLPNEMKADVELQRTAFENDPGTARHLPSDSPLVRLPSTWRAMLADEDIPIYAVPPRFPEELLQDIALLNEIVANKPYLLGQRRDASLPHGTVLDRISPENLVPYLIAFPAAYDALPEESKTLKLAKEVVKKSPRSELAERLIEQYGADLALLALEEDIYARYDIPEAILNEPKVQQYLRTKILESTEEECPHWVTEYAKSHPEIIGTLVDKKSEWTADYGFMKIPGVLQLVAARADELLTTPERLETFLAARHSVSTEDKVSLDRLEQILRNYEGEITRGIEHGLISVLSDVRRGGERLSDEMLELVVSRYGVIGDWMKGRLTAMLRDIENIDVLLKITKRGGVLSFEQVKIIKDKLASNHEALYEAALNEPRVLSCLTDSEWASFTPYIRKKLSGSLDDLSKLYSLLPEGLRADRDLALRATLIDTDNYYYIPDSLMRDEDFVVELCGWGSVPAYDINRLDITSQAAAVARYPSQMHLIDEGVRRNPEFLRKVLDRNIWAYLRLMPEEQKTAWPIVRESFARLGMDMSGIKSWGDLFTRLKTKSVSPMRIRSAAGWKKIHPEMFGDIQKLTTDGDTERKVLVIASTHDWNGALRSVPLIDRMDELGIEQVDYREIGSESELRELLEELRSKGIVYDEIVIAGHGTKDSIALSGEDRRVARGDEIDDEPYVDFSDFDDPTLGMSDLLSSDGSLILLSCSNGSGGADEDNMANRYAGTLKKGQRVVSSQVITNVIYMDLDEAGRTEWFWMGNSPYIVEGRRS